MESAYRNAGGRPKGSKTRFPGICRDADALGVNVMTLHRTLTGAWHLPGLLARYQLLKSKELTEPSKTDLKKRNHMTQAQFQTAMLNAIREMATACKTIEQTLERIAPKTGVQNAPTADVSAPQDSGAPAPGNGGTD